MAKGHAVPSAARFCGPQPTLTPRRLVMTKCVCQSIRSGACNVEKMVSPTTPGVVRRQSAERAPALPIEREVNQRQRFGQHDDDHANHEDQAARAPYHSNLPG